MSCILRPRQGRFGIGLVIFEVSRQVDVSRIKMSSFGRVSRDFKSCVLECFCIGNISEWIRTRIDCFLHGRGCQFVTFFHLAVSTCLQNLFLLLILSLVYWYKPATSRSSSVIVHLHHLSICPSSFGSTRCSETFYLSFHKLFSVVSLAKELGFFLFFFLH